MFTGVFVNCVPKTSRGWVEGAWVGKSVILAVLFLGMLFVPRQYSVNIFKYVSAVLALVFMVTMSIHLIDLSYKLSVKWK